MINQDACVLAVDLGASGGKSFLVRFDGAKLHMEETYRFQNRYMIRDGRAHWDISRIFRHIRSAISGCGGKARSVGIDSWGVDAGLLDRNGRLLHLPRSYRDRAFSVDNMVEFAERFGGCDALSRRSGIDCHSNNTLFQLYAMGKEGFLDGCAHALMLPNLLEYFLSGQMHSEYTSVSTSQLYRMNHRCMDTEVLAALGLPEDLFPPVEYAGRSLGELKKDIAEEAGGSMEVVSVQGHDTACAASAIPLDHSEFTFLSSGTWSLMGLVTDTPLSLPGVSNEGIGRGKYRPTINIPGMWILQECQRQWAKEGRCYSSKQMVELAGQEDDRSTGLVPPDLFSCPGNYPAQIRAYCAETGQAAPQTDGQIVRTVLNSLAMRYRMAYEKLHPDGKRMPLCIVGGGSNNELLNQITANAIGVPILKGPTEASALGNALTQMEAHGLLDPSQRREVLRNSFQTVLWEPVGGEKWEKMYSDFCRLFYSLTVQGNGNII